MKKVLLAVLFLCACAFPQTTPNLNLNIPATGTQNWGVLVNANFTMLDTLLACYGHPVTPGTIVYWNGSIWTCFPGNTSGTNFFSENASGVANWAPAGGTGTVTSVSSGAGLTGGVITTSGTLAVANGGVTNAMLVNSSITLNGTANQISTTGVSLSLGGPGSTLSLANPLIFPGKFTAIASNTGNAGANFPHGSAPISPTNGDFWSTAAGFFGQVNGTTVGPFGVAGTGLSGMTTGQVGVAGSATTITSSKAILGTDTSLVSGIGAFLATNIPCGDANGGITPCTTLPASLTIPSATLSGASTVVPNGATVTIQNGGTLTCAAGSTCPAGTGTVTHTVGALAPVGAPVDANGGADVVSEQGGELRVVSVTSGTDACVPINTLLLSAQTAGTNMPYISMRGVAPNVTCASDPFAGFNSSTGAELDLGGGTITTDVPWMIPFHVKVVGNNGSSSGAFITTSSNFHSNYPTIVGNNTTDTVCLTNGSATVIAGTWNGSACAKGGTATFTAPYNAAGLASPPAALGSGSCNSPGPGWTAAWCIGYYLLISPSGVPPTPANTLSVGRVIAVTDSQTLTLATAINGNVAHPLTGTGFQFAFVMPVVSLDMRNAVSGNPNFGDIEQFEGVGIGAGDLITSSHGVDCHIAFMNNYMQENSWLRNSFLRNAAWAYVAVEGNAANSGPYSNIYALGTNAYPTSGVNSCGGSAGSTNAGGVGVIIRQVGTFHGFENNTFNIRNGSTITANPGFLIENFNHTTNGLPNYGAVNIKSNHVEVGSPGDSFLIGDTLNWPWATGGAGATGAVFINNSGTPANTSGNVFHVSATTGAFANQNISIEGTITEGTNNCLQDDVNSLTYANCPAKWVGPATLGPVVTDGTAISNSQSATSQFAAWKNITPAVVGTSQGSPVLSDCGTAFHGSASVEDCMTFSELPGNGNDAPITFNLGHTGTSTGTVTTQFPGPVAAGASGSGAGGAVVLPEGTTVSGIAANDIIWGDSANHCAHQNFNNVDIGCSVSGGTAAVNSGDLASYNGTTGFRIQDSNVVAANVTTQTSNGAANQVCTYTGANKVCVPGSVGNSALTNSSITIAGTPVALGGSTSSFPSPGAIGGTTPAAITGTTIQANTQVTAGVAGTLAPVVFGNATSGTVTLNPVTGALGSTTDLLPVAVNSPATLVQTIASGTAAMGTGAISSGTCATVVTVAATNAATTDTIIVTPNADPTGVTGYAVSATGSLYIQSYPTAGNVNFKVCNNTGGSLTPSALTLNWRVIR